MPLNSQIPIMQKFIDEHQTQYVGKYRYHSSYRISDFDFKARYYIFDENFRQLDIFVEIHVNNQVTYHFSEDFHEQEQVYIIKDILKRLIDVLQFKSSLHYSLYEVFLNNYQKNMILDPIDYVNLLNYMKYHQGINQKTIDAYYELFIPCLKAILMNENYKKFMDSINYLFHVILYEYEWEGTSLKYLDTEYQYHLYYIRKIVRMVYDHLDKFYKYVPNELIDVICIFCHYERFSLAIMTDFGTLVLSHYHVCKSIMAALKQKFVLCEKGQNHDDENLVFSYIYYIFINDYEQYYNVVIKVLRHVVNNMLVFANHDLDLALGNSILQTEGFETVIDLFEEDYNTFIFTCFPISTFPKEMRLRVRDELVTAIQFFAARMENEKYRLSSFEQVGNINRLLMENFREWYK